MIDDRNDFILQLYDSGLHISEIVKEYGYTESIVEKCIYKFRKINKCYKMRKITKEQEEDIIESYISGKKTTKLLSEKYHVSNTTIMLIINNYKNTI